AQGLKPGNPCGGESEEGHHFLLRVSMRPNRRKPPMKTRAVATPFASQKRRYSPITGPPSRGRRAWRRHSRRRRVQDCLGVRTLLLKAPPLPARRTSRGATCPRTECCFWGTPAHHR